MAGPAYLNKAIVLVLCWKPPHEDHLQFWWAVICIRSWWMPVWKLSFNINSKIISIWLQLLIVLSIPWPLTARILLVCAMLKQSVMCSQKIGPKGQPQFWKQVLHTGIGECLVYWVVSLWHVIFWELPVAVIPNVADYPSNCSSSNTHSMRQTQFILRQIQFRA